MTNTNRSQTAPKPALLPQHFLQPIIRIPEEVVLTTEPRNLSLEMIVVPGLSKDDYVLCAELGLEVVDFVEQRRNVGAVVFTAQLVDVPGAVSWHLPTAVFG